MAFTIKNESINVVDIEEEAIDVDIDSSLNVIHINIGDNPEILPKVFEMKNPCNKHVDDPNTILYQIKPEEISTSIYPTFEKLNEELVKQLVPSHKVLVSTVLKQSNNSTSGASIGPYNNPKNLTPQQNDLIKSHHINNRIKNTNALTLDCCTQTHSQNSPEDNKTKSLNVFFCTFHQNGDAETLCNISPPVQRKVKIESSIKDNITDKCTPTSHLSESVSSASNNIKKVSTLDPLFPTVQLIPDKRKRGRPKLSYCDESNSDWEKEFFEDSNIESGDEPNVLQLSVSEEKGYGLRTQRRLKKHCDMLYNSMKTQQKIKSKFGVLKCTFCPEEYTTFCKLQKHSKIVHNSSKFSFPCDLCGVTFTRPHNLRRHKEAKHVVGEKKFLCEHCGRRFTRQDVLNSHMYLIHLKTVYKNTKSIGKKKPAFQCSSCDKPFSRIQNFHAHQSGNLTCSKCCKTFVCKTRLRNHLYKQHPVTCCVCLKTCANKQQLYFHKLTHTPKFNCKFCNKGFLWESQYTVHLATHTGNKPLICEVCGKTFAHKNAVNKHKWQEHTEANKKFPCKVCGRAFVYKAKLDSHLRSHTGEKPFVCHLCPSSFSQNCNLAAHIKSVHGVYVQSVKSDGSMQTELVKYRRVSKKVSKSSAESTLPPHSPDQPDQVSVVSIPETESSEIKVADEEHEVELDTQVYTSEEVQFTDSFSSAETIYQIVYTYPQ